MTINTNWSGITEKNTDWTSFNAGGRHTYGAEYGKTTRIRLGDHVRYGGVANMISGVNTNWQGVY